MTASNNAVGKEIDEQPNVLMPPLLPHAPICHPSESCHPSEALLDTSHKCNAPTAVPTDTSSNHPTAVSTDHPATVPTDHSADVPTDTSINHSAIVPTDHPAEVPTDTSNNHPATVPTDHPAEVPTDTSSNHPATTHFVRTWSRAMEEYLHFLLSIVEQRDIGLSELRALLNFLVQQTLFNRSQRAYLLQERYEQPP